MVWFAPIDFKLIPSDDTLSFQKMAPNETTLPLPPHPGAFGVVRKHHVHEGLDLYCPAGTAVHAVEAGVVVGRIPFTGPKAGSPWWCDTEAILVEGPSGVVVYGEIDGLHLQPGMKVSAGQMIGRVIQVLQKDKGRPMSMLHLELHEHGTRDVYEWKVGSPKPFSLRDPLEYLRTAQPLPKPGKFPGFQP